VPGLPRKSSGHIRLGGAIRILPSDIQGLYEAPRFPLEARRQREWNMDSARAERAVLGDFVGIALREYALDTSDGFFGHPRYAYVRVGALYGRTSRMCQPSSRSKTRHRSGDGKWLHG
jgi:hypothetical protein